MSQAEENAGCLSTFSLPLVLSVFAGIFFFSWQSFNYTQYSGEKFFSH